MSWFLAAVMSAVGLSAQALAFRRLQKFYPINSFMSYIWLGAALVLSLLFLRAEHLEAIGRNILPLVISGITSMTGNYAYNRAIHRQGNIGYIEAVMSWRLVLTYVFSLIVLNAAFDVLRLGGVALIAAGVLAVSGAWRMNLKDLSLDWVGWSLAGGLSFGLSSIFARFANEDGVPGEVSLIIVLLVAGVVFLAAALREKSPLKIDLSHGWLMLATIAIAALGNGALFVAYARAPNLAYAVAIDNSRIIILYLVGLAMFSETWMRTKAAGIALTFVGILLLS